MSNSSRVNWPARIVLWILWPIGWMILLPIAQGLLSGIRVGLVQTAKQGVNVGAVASTYGVVNAIVMGGLTLLLPAGFVFAARVTHKKEGPPTLPPLKPNGKQPSRVPSATKPKKRTHGCLVSFLVCLSIFILLAALGVFGGRQAVMKSAEKSMRESPLCVATAVGNWQEVDRLLARGVNPNQSAMMGHSALIMATDHGHLQIAERLLKAGADPNQKDKLGWAPLHHAVKTQAANLDMITILALYRANVNITDKHLRTPLHRAAQFGHIEAVRLLLRWGADPNAKDENGWTPRDRGGAHPRIVAALRPAAPEKPERVSLEDLFKEELESPKPTMRLWTSYKGNYLRASLEQESDGYVVLRDSNGKRWKIERWSLSQADIAYLNSLK